MTGVAREGSVTNQSLRSQREVREWTPQGPIRCIPTTPPAKAFPSYVAMGRNGLCVSLIVEQVILSSDGSGEIDPWACYGGGGGGGEVVYRNGVGQVTCLDNRMTGGHQELPTGIQETPSGEVDSVDDGEMSRGNMSSG